MTSVLAGLFSFLLAFIFFLIYLNLPNFIELNEVLNLMFVFLPFLFLTVGIILMVRK
jgi:hypothetical protein